VPDELIGSNVSSQGLLGSKDRLKPANASSGKHTTDMDTLRDEMLAADLPICPVHFHSQLM
ncbi:hypothetical protein, partial [Pseudomonas savastanoi]|uniref:hypothetical protein n=1 Tax=Pseudomonas savastanoi TaxID=29438 RepID=UPI001B80B57D